MRLILHYLLMLALAVSAAPAASAETGDPAERFFELNIGDLNAELVDAKNAGKKAIFLMYEQEGCPGCLHMRKHVLSRADVQKFYHEHFLNFSIDVRSAVPLRDFAGRELTEQSFSRNAGIRGTPTLAFYDLEGAEIVRFTGPVKDGAEFLLLGEFVASGAYRTRNFAQFLQQQAKKKGS